MPFINYFIIPFVFDAAIAANFLVLNLYAQDLGATPLNLGLMSFIWGSVYAGTSLTTGRVSHRLPRRAAMIAAMWCFFAAVVTAQFARAPWHLYFMVAVNGVGCACFWPLFAALLHDEDETAHKRKMTCFNVGWTAGLAVGSAAGGFLKEAGSAQAINTLAGVVALLAVYFQCSTRRGLPPVHMESERSDPDAALEEQPKTHFLHMSWLANFAVFAGGSAVCSLFPKLARELSFPDRAIGLVQSLIVVSQALAFFALGRSAWWRHRLLPLLGAQLLGTMGLVLVAMGSTYAVFGCAMIGLGVARAVTYASSLHYGLLDAEKRSHNMGVHEMLIGAAVAVGALLGGIAGNCISLRFAFWVGAGVVIAAMVAELAIFCSQRLGGTTSDEVSN